MRVPRFIYGTAWKEHRTEGLTRLALEVGFRGIDTANQRKHYFEAGVGAAIAAAGIARDELFLQTKFTDVRGQDHRLPYDPDAPPFSSELIWRQVEQSFASSLTHLGVDHVDSYVLHGPESGRGWSAADREVWSAMERLHRERRARLLGVSNISRDQLVTLCGSATVAPALVQNRCYARTGWDQEVRRGLSRARHRLPGVLPADRQPARAARSDRGGDRPPAGRHHPAGGIPLRLCRRHGGTHRDLRPDPHAAGPGSARSRYHRVRRGRPGTTPLSGVASAP